MFRYAKIVRLASLRLSLALSGSFWISPCLSLALYGSLWLPIWLSLALTATLWHTLALSGSLLLSYFAYTALGSQGPCSALIADAMMKHFIPLCPELIFCAASATDSCEKFGQLCKFVQIISSIIFANVKLHYYVLYMLLHCINGTFQHKELTTTNLKVTKLFQTKK